jgi:hypothetical protein
MKISSDLGNRHPVTSDQLVMPAEELSIQDEYLECIVNE